MKRQSFTLATLGALVLAAAPAFAQAPAGQAQGPGRGQGAPGGAAGGGPGTPTKNLQVLPKDYTVQQIIPVMQAFSSALGVTCAYCHEVFAPGDPRNDLASDAKPAKNTARAMMRMAQTVNMTLSTSLNKPAAELTRVGCVTCHRGVPVPKQLVDIVLDTTKQKDAQAAIAQYRDLRKQFYGAQAYDFSDATLFTAAQRATQANKPDDAILYAQANLEFNPTSARSYEAISQAYQRKMDTPKAIEALEKAVAMDPMNMQFKNQLNQLKNPGQGQPPARGQQ